MTITPNEIIYGAIWLTIIIAFAVVVVKFLPREKTHEFPCVIVYTSVYSIDSAMRSFSEEVWDAKVDIRYPDEVDVQAVRAFWWLTHSFHFDYDDGSSMLDFFPHAYICVFDSMGEFYDWYDNEAEHRFTAVHVTGRHRRIFVFRGAWE
jgi:hypothetical protein